MGKRTISDFFITQSGKSSESKKNESQDSKRAKGSQELISSTWTLNNYALKKRYNAQVREKSEILNFVIYGFDLDSTLVKTKGRSPFATNADDWQWFNDSVKFKLKEISQEENHVIIIFSNQGGVIKGGKRYDTFQKRLDNIAKSADGIEIWVYAAIAEKKGKKTDKIVKEQEKKITKKPDYYRKPATGLWHEFKVDFESLIGPWSIVDMEKSVYIGDAAGRKGDFSDSDLKFAENVKLAFKTPEEYFVEK